jgi:hypothetical protein
MHNLIISPELDREKFATTFRVAGRIGFWIQLALGAVAALSLGLAVLSRGTRLEVSNPGIGLGIFFALCSLLILVFRIYWALRYGRLAKRLKEDDPAVHPSKGIIFQVLRTGLLVSLVGLLAAFLASEVSILAVLANSLAQPQGVAVYNRENIVPTLDLFVVLANVNLTGAHLLGGVNSLALINWITQ